MIFLISDEFKSRKRKKVKLQGTVGEGEGRQSKEAGGDGVSEKERDDGGGAKRKRETIEDRIQSDPSSQVYLKWRENTLRLARERLIESEP